MKTCVWKMKTHMRPKSQSLVYPFFLVQEDGGMVTYSFNLT
jgi:hypothetical protein